jgi:hypothetical protein
MPPATPPWSAAWRFCGAWQEGDKKCQPASANKGDQNPCLRDGLKWFEGIRAMSETTEPFREKRVAVRAASYQETYCHFATLEKLACRWGKVRDLSRLGISFVFEDHFTPGQLLIVELPSKTPATNAVPARVVYALPQKDGACLAGCSFARPLADQEYQALL